MAKVYGVEKIRKCLPKTQKLLDAIQEGFCEYSERQAEINPPLVLRKNRVTVAPVSQLKFDSHAEQPGECCIKSGYVRGADYFIVKVASNFPANSSRSGGSISNSQGAMMVFSQRTGQLQAVLDDGGELTDIRTAMAACMCARALASNQDVLKIGFIGAGTIASLTALTMRKIFPEASILAWSRTQTSANLFKTKMEKHGWKSVTVVSDTASMQECDLIVTATPSQTPVLLSCKVGAVIIAVGADTPGKRELGPAVMKGACVVCDSRVQCLQFGESAHARDEKLLREEGIVELGVILSGVAAAGCVDKHRLGMQGKTIVVDLTGVAVQDVVIATLVLAELRHHEDEDASRTNSGASVPGHQ